MIAKFDRKQGQTIPDNGMIHKKESHYLLAFVCLPICTRDFNTSKGRMENQHIMPVVPNKLRQYLTNEFEKKKQKAKKKQTIKTYERWQHTSRDDNSQRV